MSKSQILMSNKVQSSNAQNMDLGSHLSFELGHWTLHSGGMS
jgi:hypothetical protein